MRLLLALIFCASAHAEEVKYTHWNDEVKSETTVTCNAFATINRLTFSCAHNFDSGDSRVFSSNKTLDIALLNIKGLLELRLSEKDAFVGDEVDVVGSFAGKGVKIHRAKISELFYQGSCRGVLEIEDFELGASGSPVMHGYYVVGMVVAAIPDNNGGYLKNKCLFVPVSVLREAVRQSEGGSVDISVHKTQTTTLEIKIKDFK